MEAEQFPNDRDSLSEAQREREEERLLEFIDEVTHYMAYITGEDPEEMKKEVDSYPMPDYEP